MAQLFERMTAIVRKILKDFEALPPHDQREVAVEILRRAAGESEIPEEALNGWLGF